MIPDVPHFKITFMGESCCLYTHEDGFEIMKGSETLLQVDRWDDSAHYNFDLDSLIVNEIIKFESRNDFEAFHIQHKAHTLEEN